MRKLITLIDKGIKDLYQLSDKYPAEDFLIQKPWPIRAIANQAQHGALYIDSARDSNEDLHLGIYLDENTRKQLNSIEGLKVHQFTTQQLQAFCVAVEELSHFNYFVYHVLRGRVLSELEIELQGEVDKFLIVFYSRTTAPGLFFDNLYDCLFNRYATRVGLNPVQADRYQQASDYAAKFIGKNREKFMMEGEHHRLLKRLRDFYRLNLAEKINQIEN